MGGVKIRRSRPAPELRLNVVRNDGLVMWRVMA